jgi:hypothetical protein
MASAQRLANSPKTFLERDNWIRAVLACDLPDAAVRIAITIAFQLRVTTGRCDPTYPRLAVDSHVSERSTYRLVDLLEHRGWIAITRTSGRGNYYTLLTPDRAMTGVTPDKAMAGVRRTTPDSPDRGTPDRAMAGDHCQYAGSTKERAKKAKKESGKKDSRAADSASPFRLEPDTLPRAESAEPSKGRRRKESEAKPQARLSPAELAEQFERFWRAYPRKVAKDAARKAFERAIKGVGNPDVLIMGAKRYAVERQNEPAKYTKHPATWLNAGCWDDEAPGAPVLNETGELIAFEQEEEPKRRKTPLEIALGWLEDGRLPRW